MVRKFFGLFAILLAMPLFFIACGDEGSGESLVGRIDSDGIVFSPAGINGRVAYLPSMKAEKVVVVALDYDLDPLDTMEIVMEDAEGYFSTGTREWKSPYAKITTVFAMEDSDEKMEFTQYENVGRYWGECQTLPAAIAFDRMTDLVKKEGYTLDEAKSAVEQELASEFGGKTDGQTNPFRDSSWRKLYYYTRHFVNDSVFYSDFRDFRERFRDRKVMDSDVNIRIADALFRYFPFRASFHEFKNETRDSAYGFDGFAFVKKTYGFSENNIVEGNVQKNEDQRSEFYGQTFVYDSYVDSRHYVNRFWRPVVPLEDTLGVCTRIKSEMMRYDGKYYSCDNDSSSWREQTDAIAILTFQFGTCSRRYGTYGKIHFYQDSAYRCDSLGNEDRHDEWHVYEMKLDRTDSATYAEEVAALAYVELGSCRTNGANDGKKVQLNDSAFVRCSDGKWKSIPSEEYWSENCGYFTKGTLSKLPDGRYFKCVSDGDWGVKLQEITAAEYEGNKCEKANHGTVVLAGGAYFKCDARCDDCGSGRWNVLAGEDSIPPVWNMDPCGNAQNNLLEKYDGKFYVCSGGRWSAAPDSLLTPPVLDGYICSDSLREVDRKYGDVYYVCRNNNSWQALDEENALPLEYRDLYGPCEGMIGTSIKFDAERKKFFGCGKNSKNEFQWINYTFDSLYSVPGDIKTANFVAGKFTDLKGYAFRSEPYSYEFFINDNSKLIISRIEISGTWYDAYYYGGRLFIHAPRGGALHYITTPGEEEVSSFALFYKDWYDRVVALASSNEKFTEMYQYKYVSGRSEESFSTWDTAKSFCPEGFHIPSRVEFSQENYLRYMTDNTFIRNDSYFQVGYVVNGYRHWFYYDIFWTSTEKDEDTQVCYEYAADDLFNPIVNHFVDCPKDVYPMIQAICVQDE